MQGLYLKQPEPAKDGALAPVLRAAAGKHLLVAGLDTEMLAKVASHDTSAPAAEALKPLLKARSALLTVDLGEDLEAEARLTFAGESDAKAGEEAADSALDLARSGMVMELQEAKKQPGMGRIVALLEDVQAGLRSAKVETKGSAVTATMTVKIDPEKTGSNLIDAVQKARVAAARMNSINNLKQLVLAMHNYHDVYGQFPADATYDKAGKPLLSWRVAILPYIEQDNLYKQFHLDEPWDSDHNKKLLEQMPPLYGFGDATAAKNHETPLPGDLSARSVFRRQEKASRSTDRTITDGTSNTAIMLVEGEEGRAVDQAGRRAFRRGETGPEARRPVRRHFQRRHVRRLRPLLPADDQGGHVNNARHDQRRRGRGLEQVKNGRSQGRAGARGGSASSVPFAPLANVSEDESNEELPRIVVLPLHHAPCGAPGVEPGPSR